MPRRHPDQPRAFAPAAVVAIAVLAAAGCGSTSPKPTAQASPAAAQDAGTPGPAPPRTFTSRRYGFRVTLNRNWTETDAATGWDGEALQGLDSPAFANFQYRATDTNLAVAAAKVGQGMRLPVWRAAMVRAAPAACAESRSAEKTTLGGRPALTWTAKCEDGYEVHKLAALHGSRGYMLLLASQTPKGNAADGRIFDSMRRSFRFSRS